VKLRLKNKKPWVFLILPTVITLFLLVFIVSAHPRQNGKIKIIPIIEISKIA
jgi:hypothetical protein